MKYKYLILISLIFIILSCNAKDELKVKNIAGKEIDILETKKPKIIVISCGEVCHDCVKNLDEYIAENYKLDNFAYSVLYKDPGTIMARRWTKETYLNDYAPNMQNIYFCAESPKTQEILNIPDDLFKQLTPYIVYIGTDNKPIYKSFEVIFNRDGSVKKSFKIK